MPDYALIFHYADGDAADAMPLLRCCARAVIDTTRLSFITLCCHDMPDAILLCAARFRATAAT